MAHAIRRERIDASKPINLVDYLNRSVPGVWVNEITGAVRMGPLAEGGWQPGRCRADPGWLKKRPGIPWHASPILRAASRRE